MSEKRLALKHLGYKYWTPLVAAIILVVLFSVRGEGLSQFVIIQLIITAVLTIISLVVATTKGSPYPTWESFIGAIIALAVLIVVVTVPLYMEIGKIQGKLGI